ncbi:MAG: hypothetical protein AAFV53_38275 [Myxococcota bacterium]
MAAVSTSVNVPRWFPTPMIQALHDVRVAVELELRGGLQNRGGQGVTSLNMALIEKFITQVHTQIQDGFITGWVSTGKPKYQLGNGAERLWMLEDDQVLISLRTITRLKDYRCPNSGTSHEARNIEKSISDYVPAPGGPTVLGDKGPAYKEVFIIGPVPGTRAGYLDNPPRLHGIRELFIGAPASVVNGRCVEWKQGSGVVLWPESDEVTPEFLPMSPSVQLRLT